MRVTYGLAYLPQAAAVAAASTVTDDFAAIATAGRLAALAAAIGLTALAIRLLPFGSWTAAVIALLPMAVFVRSSLSIDGVIMGAALLLIALLIRWRETLHQGGSASAATVLAAAAAAAFLASTKSPYLALLTLTLPLLISPAGRRPGEIAKIGAVIATAGAVVLTWGRYVASHCAFARKDMDPALFDLAAKKASLLEHPTAFIRFFADSVAHDLAGMAQQAVGVLGLLDFHLPTAFYLLAAVVLLATAALDPSHRETGKADWETALSTTATFLAGACILWLSLWLLWTPIGAARIDGMQGRYFLPLLPCAGLAAGTLLSRLPWSLSLARRLPVGVVAPVASVILLGWAMIAYGVHERDAAAIAAARSAAMPLQLGIADLAAAAPLQGVIDSRQQVENIVILRGWAPWHDQDSERDLRVAADFPVTLAAAISLRRPDVATAGVAGEWSGFQMFVVADREIPPTATLRLLIYKDGVPTATLNPPAR
jgi:hypothetical protein